MRVDPGHIRKEDCDIGKSAFGLWRGLSCAWDAAAACALSSFRPPDESDCLIACLARQGKSNLGLHANQLLRGID